MRIWSQESSVSVIYNIHECKCILENDSMHWYDRISRNPHSNLNTCSVTYCRLYRNTPAQMFASMYLMMIIIMFQYKTYECNTTLKSPSVSHRRLNVSKKLTLNLRSKNFYDIFSVFFYFILYQSIHFYIALMYFSFYRNLYWVEAIALKS